MLRTIFLQQKLTVRPILFIDRDGTIIQETEDNKIEKLTFLKDILYYLRKIQKETDYLFVMVSNQDGLGTSDFLAGEFWPVHKFILRTLEGEQVRFDAVHIDEHHESDNHPNRKPGTNMLRPYLAGSYDISNSCVIGDRITDVQLAENLGCKAIHFSSKHVTSAALTTDSWKKIYKFLTGLHTFPGDANDHQ